MIRPNYRDFRIRRNNIVHSAKGSTWEEHKYIKRIDGTYYYPDSYNGGRHLPSSDDKEETSADNDVISKLEKLTGMTKESLNELKELSRKNGYDSDEFKEMLSILSEGDDDQAKKMIDLLKEDQGETSLSSEDIEKLAKEVIRGNFGNGQVRKDLLGENYSEIQKRVNEILGGSAGSKKVSEVSDESIKKAEEAAKKASEDSSKDSKVHSGIDIDQVLRVYRKK